MTFDGKKPTTDLRFINPTEETFTPPPVVFEKVDINEAIRNFLPSMILLDFPLMILKRTNLSIQTTKNEGVNFSKKSFFNSAQGLWEMHKTEGAFKNGGFFLILLVL